MRSDVMQWWGFSVKIRHHDNVTASRQDFELKKRATVHLQSVLVNT